MEDILRRLRQAAALGGMDIDQAAYAAANLATSEPVLLGSGSLSAKVGIMGRDPGRQEIMLQEPFVGAGGRLLRAGLHSHHHGSPPPDHATARLIGQQYFWCNTVPYKPTRNRAWSVKIKRRFAPIIADYIVEHWAGQDLITCGRVAFDWFRLMEPALAPSLKTFWTTPGCFSRHLPIVFMGKSIRLHPLPHPSPLNARWRKQFPSLLQDRLAAVETNNASTPP